MYRAKLMQYVWTVDDGNTFWCKGQDILIPPLKIWLFTYIRVAPKSLKIFRFCLELNFLSFSIWNWVENLVLYEILSCLKLKWNCFTLETEKEIFLHKKLKWKSFYIKNFFLFETEMEIWVNLPPPLHQVLCFKL